MALGPIMTVDEVAESLRCSRLTIYRLLHNGKIPGAFRIGSDWRVRSDKFREWIQRTEGTNKSSRT